eukprot:TRINITY_DN11229_c0_g1_i1.p1 TRINITY_DN11229_c0_g1~~TRINITY_DN11229_c0_g1_i1.p1  ORF type:complete len:217 (+),score=2.61 TRINITY_DN11229_c0_g1_i1:340-990(+)
MKKKGWKCDEALSFVKSKREVIEPNPGFKLQLLTYEHILSKSTSRIGRIWIRRYQIEKFCQHIGTTKPCTLNKKCKELEAYLFNQAEDQHKIGMLTCAKCRARLFSKSNLNTFAHRTGISPQSVLLRSEQVLHQHASQSNSNDDARECAFVFTEPTTWMDVVSRDEFQNTIALTPSGKIRCYKCKSQIGRWDWEGLTCSCSAFILPAFRITRKAVI